MGQLFSTIQQLVAEEKYVVGEHALPDGTEFKAVWAHLRQSGVAKLVTVHFFDRG